MRVVRTLSVYDIAGLLMDDQYANWSRDAAYGIAEYLENLADALGENIEFDVVGIRCDFSEYDLEDIIYQYEVELGIDTDEEGFEVDDYTMDEVADKLRDCTTVAWHNDNSIVISDF